MKALSDAEAIGVARDLCVMPLLYYSYPRPGLEQDQGLGGQRHGRPPDPLPLQGIARNRDRPPLLLMGQGGRPPKPELRIDAALRPEALPDRDPDAVRDRDDLVLPDARRAGRPVQSGKGPEPRHQGQSRAGLPPRPALVEAIPALPATTCSTAISARATICPISPWPNSSPTGLPISIQLGGSALVLALLLGGIARHHRGALPEQAG